VLIWLPKNRLQTSQFQSQCLVSLILHELDASTEKKKENPMIVIMIPHKGREGDRMSITRETRGLFKSSLEKRSHILISKCCHYLTESALQWIHGALQESGRFYDASYQDSAATFVNTATQGSKTRSDAGHRGADRRSKRSKVMFGTIATHCINPCFECKAK